MVLLEDNLKKMKDFVKRTIQKVKAFFKDDIEIEKAFMDNLETELKEYQKSLKDLHSEYKDVWNTYHIRVEEYNKQLEKGMDSNIANSIEYINKRFNTFEKGYLLQVKNIVGSIQEIEDIKKGKDQDYADVIIFNEKEEILLLLRNKDSDFEPDKWGLPGGKIENKESADMAAMREAQEETGIRLKKIYPVMEKEIPGGCIYYYQAQMNDNKASKITLDSEEHYNYMWVDTDNLKDYTLLKDSRKNIEEILKDIKIEKALRIIKDAFIQKLITEEQYNSALQKKQ